LHYLDAVEEVEDPAGEERGSLGVVGGSELSAK
jgi:hypothetical protein